MKRLLPILLLFALLLPPRSLVRAAPADEIASYTIDVTLDAATRQLSARQTITYRNASDTPIPDLVFHLYLNAFRDTSTIFMREGGGAMRGFGANLDYPGWIEVQALRIQNGPDLRLTLLEDGTLARAVLPTPAAPGETLRLEVEFTAQLPQVFARTGWAPDASGQPYFMVGQWFPKLGVWQGARGWNAYPFHANSEFFADYASFDVTLHLPANYVSGAVGMPQGEPVLNGDRQSIRYRAENVIDFAWTASPSFETATRSISLPSGDLELHYLYLPEHAWTVERALTAAENAMRYFSQWYGPYPYPRLTIVDAPDSGQGAGGMEYPTLITAGALVPDTSAGISAAAWEHTLEMVVIHEAGHQWWMGLVGFNEAEEPWLDEGFTDYSAARLMEKLSGPERSLIDLGSLHASYSDLRRAEYLASPDVPMQGRAWDFQALQYGVAAYSKPLLALTTLENKLGEETMLAILSTFFQRYQYRHPTAADFRAVAEEISGQRLDWFFEGLVASPNTLDYQAEEITQDSFTAVRAGELVIPTDVQFTFQGGATRTLDWDGIESPRTFSFPDDPPLIQAEIDPQRKILVDQVWSNNGLRVQADLPAWLSVFGGLVYFLQDVLLLLGGL